jgi:hypothetical protein
MKKPAKYSFLRSFARLTILAAATAGASEVSRVSWDCSDTVAEIIPPDRKTDWTPGVTVGVPGGIPTNRSHLIDVTKAPYHADNTAAADAQPAIQKAIADAKENDVVYLPAGTYRTDLAIARGSKSKITLLQPEQRSHNLPRRRR